MKKSTSLYLFLLFLTGTMLFYTNSYAQTAQDSVKAAVNKLFEAMKNSDADMPACGRLPPLPVPHAAAACDAVDLRAKSEFDVGALHA